jgi:hypothetical protein
MGEGFTRHKTVTVVLLKKFTVISGGYQTGIKILYSAGILLIPSGYDSKKIKFH